MTSYKPSQRSVYDRTGDCKHSDMTEHLSEATPNIYDKTQLLLKAMTMTES